MADWVRERRTGDKVALGSNPADADSLQNFGNSDYPALPVSFGGDTSSHLSCVYARGSEKSYTGGKYVTCRGLKAVSPVSLVTMPGEVKDHTQEVNV